MSGSLNKVFLIGRLGQTPETRTTTSGQEVVNFSLATDESYAGQDGKKVERTEWHRIVAWGKQAEFVVNYLAKGALVCIEGKLETRKWQDQQGATRYMTEIRASRVTGLGYAQMADGQNTVHQSRFDDPDVKVAEAGSNESFPLQSCGMDNLPF